MTCMHGLIKSYSQVCSVVSHSPTYGYSIVFLMDTQCMVEFLLIE